MSTRLVFKGNIYFDENKKQAFESALKALEQNQRINLNLPNNITSPLEINYAEYRSNSGAQDTFDALVVLVDTYAIIAQEFDTEIQDEPKKIWLGPNQEKAEAEEHVKNLKRVLNALSEETKKELIDALTASLL